MKRTILTAILLLGAALPACADNDIYLDMTKQGRGDAAVSRDADICAQRYGHPQNGTRTSRAFKKCMAGRGWRFYTTRVSPTQNNDSDDSWTFDGCTFNPAASSSC